MATFVEVEFPEDEGFTIRGRITAEDGSGDGTGRSGEGNWLEQSDLTAITWENFAVTTVAGAEVFTSIDTGSFTVADVVLDTPVTTNTNWTVDQIGHNVVLRFPAIFPEGGITGRLEIRSVLTGDEPFTLILQGPVRNLATETP